MSGLTSRCAQSQPIVFSRCFYDKMPIKCSRLYLLSNCIYFKEIRPNLCVCVSVTSSNKSLRTGARSLKRSKTETSRGNARSQHRPTTDASVSAARSASSSTNSNDTDFCSAKENYQPNKSGWSHRKENTFCCIHLKSTYFVQRCMDVTNKKITLELQKFLQ